MLRKTDRFDPVCFLYASLSCISRAETVKKTLLQRDNFFQSSDKKVTWLTRTVIKVLGISEKQRIYLDIFVNFLRKKRFFFNLKQFFFISFCSFWRKAILLSIIPRSKYRFKQFLLILTGWCMNHRFAKVHLANRKQITGKKTSWVANVIFKKVRLFLRYFPIKQYRI